MRVVRTVSEFYGTNEAPIAGAYIQSSNRDFVTRGVVVGVSTLYNQTNGTSALVSTATATRLDAVGISFNPGDLWKVDLPTPWTVQEDGLVLVEIQCKRCGWSYPKKSLTNGLCQVCVDTPRRTKTV